MAEASEKFPPLPADSAALATVVCQLLAESCRGMLQRKQAPSPACSHWKCHGMSSWWFQSTCCYHQDESSYRRWCVGISLSCSHLGHPTAWKLKVALLMQKISTWNFFSVALRHVVSGCGLKISGPGNTTPWNALNVCSNIIHSHKCMPGFQSQTETSGF